jgi:hypothetical protein
MAKKTLNAGQFGGTTIDVPADKTLIAAQASDTTFWLYDLSIHPETPTADYIGTCTDADPCIKATYTLVIDFRGA